MNYQNIPRKDKVVKAAFLPKQDALVYFDFGQIEARLAAYFFSKLGWDGLLRDILNGVDVHRRMASIIFGVPQSEVTETMRDRAKTCFFGMLYGAGAKRFAEILNASGPDSWREFSGAPLKQSAAKEIVEAFRTEMPGLEILQEACIKQASRNGYLELYSGRQLKPEEFGEHKLPNALIQGTAADIMKDALVRVGRWRKLEAIRTGVRAHPVSVIHDEIIFDAPMEELPLLAEVIPDLMIAPVFNEVVPIIVEMEFSTENWSKKEEYGL